MRKDEHTLLKKLNDFSATECFRAFMDLFEVYYEQEKEKLVDASNEDFRTLQGSSRAFKKLKGIRKKMESLKPGETFDGGYR